MKKKVNIWIVSVALLLVFATMLFVAIVCVNEMIIPGIIAVAVIMIGAVLFLSKLLAEKIVGELECDVRENAKMRQEFTANVTHELKTPLTSISGYAELIKNGMASDTDVIRFAQGIHANANRLIILINDIIRLSELDDSKDEVQMEKLDLYGMAATCVEMLEPSAEKHQVSIGVNGDPCYIMANKMMMEELLYNLCDNAIRYNNVNGTVMVNVNQDREYAVLEVRDTGIGIPKEHQERIFERFYRVDKSRSKSTGGTGLGLAIVKHIIVNHNARLEVESEVGHGTLMRIFFEKKTED